MHVWGKVKTLHIVEDKHCWGAEYYAGIGAVIRHFFPKLRYFFVSSTLTLFAAVLYFLKCMVLQFIVKRTRIINFPMNSKQNC